MSQLKQIFIINFRAALSSIDVEDYEDEKYVIIPTSEQENCTSMDNIYRMWVTPTFSGIRMTFDSVIDSLVKENKNVAPLQIKISKNGNKPVMLETSRRYRKLRDIAQRKASNQNFPFEILENPEIEFCALKERKEAIRILFFTRKDSKHLKELIGDEILYKELVDNFEKHFDEYRFYPQSYNHTKEGDEVYSSLVINKDFQTNEFRIFMNPNFQESIHTKLRLEDALKIYIGEELNYEFCGIRIGKSH